MAFKSAPLSNSKRIASHSYRKKIKQMIQLAQWIKDRSLTSSERKAVAYFADPFEYTSNRRD